MERAEHAALHRGPVDQLPALGDVRPELARQHVDDELAARVLVRARDLVAVELEERRELVEQIVLDLQPRHALRIAAELDVGAATGHVRGDRHAALSAGLGDDLGFARVVLRVQDLVLDALVLEEPAHDVGLLDRGRPDEDRLSLLVRGADVRHHRVELLALVLVDDVVAIVAHHGLVGRDDDDVEVVDLLELLRLGLGRARHAGELLVHAEVVLEGDRRVGLALLLDRELLLRFDGLVESVGPTSPVHEPARVLVDDHDLAAEHHVVAVALEERVRLQRLAHVVEDLHVVRVVEVVDPELGLDLVDPVIGEVHALRLLVERVVGLVLEPRHDPVDDVVAIDRLVRRARDDQRCARLVDEDRVDLVDDRVVVRPLHVLLERELHVVAEVVEAELVVRAVRDVAGVRVALDLRVPFVREDLPDRDAEEAVDLPHPVGVARREVVVHGDDVHALPRERVQVHGQRRHERLSFARLHLGDVSAVEHDSAEELHVEVPHVHHASADLADHGEGLGEDLVQRRAVRDALLELRRDRLEVVVGRGLHRRLEIVDPTDHRVPLLELPLRGCADDLVDVGLDELEHLDDPGRKDPPICPPKRRGSSGPGRERERERERLFRQL